MSLSGADESYDLFVRIVTQATRLIHPCIVEQASLLHGAHQVQMSSTVSHVTRFVFRASCWSETCRPAGAVAAAGGILQRPFCCSETAWNTWLSGLECVHESSLAEM